MVTIVTAFHTIPHHLIAAPCGAAGVEAGIGVDLIAVVAFFAAGAQNPITAASGSAGVRTGV